MSKAEKYLPFFLAAFAPGLSFLNNPIEVEGMEWTTFGIRYLQSFIILLLFWYLNRWLLKSNFGLKRTGGFNLLIVLANILVIGFFFLLDFYISSEMTAFFPRWVIMIRLVMMVIIINVILRVLKAQQESSELKTQNLTLKAENLTFQIETLKQQINPHFLFNSLNTLLDLIEEEKESAIEYVRNFSNLYRTVLQSTHHNFIPLEDELRFLQEYWSLLKVRFGESIDLKIDVSDEIRRRQIPPLSLQFLVENAVKHNEATERKPLQIEILELNNRLIISNKMNPKKYHVASEQVGLINLQNRFTMLIEPIEQKIENGKFIVVLPLKS